MLENGRIRTVGGSSEGYVYLRWSVIRESQTKGNALESIRTRTGTGCEVCSNNNTEKGLQLGFFPWLTEAFCLQLNPEPLD